MSLNLVVNGYFIDQPTTGSGQYCRELLQELAPLWDGAITVLTPEAGDGPAPPAFPPTVTVRTVPVPLRGPAGKVWFERVSVPRAARRAGAQVLWVPYLGPPRTSPAPLVVTVHDVIQLAVPALRGGVLHRWYNRSAARAVARAAAVLADSDHTRSEVMHHLGVSPDRVHRVYLGVTAAYSPAAQPGERERIARRYGLPGVFILYMGGLDWRKNVALLIRAYARSGSTVPLAIAGAPRSGNKTAFPDLPAVVSECGAADRVRFLGWVEEADKAALYRAAHLFVFPSRFEGFGLTPLEAMACGAPVLCSNAGSLPEVTGDAALQFDPDDEAGLAGLLRSVAGDGALLAQLRRRGPEQAARFRWQETARQTLSVLRDAAGGTP